MRTLLLSLTCALLFSAAAFAQTNNECVTVQSKRFYPEQAGSEMYFLTNNCTTDINVDLATPEQTYLVRLTAGQGRFAGSPANVPYQLWYCNQPQFPSDPNNEPLNGPKYGATGVVCRN